MRTALALSCIARYYVFCFTIAVRLLCLLMNSLLCAVVFHRSAEKAAGTALVGIVRYYDVCLHSTIAVERNGAGGTVALQWCCPVIVRYYDFYPCELPR